MDAVRCVCAADPLWLDVLWSCLGLCIGVILGYVVRGVKEKKK